ncbi:hypothetical protein RND81_08G168800 [Saponaria officinalis]|uniref:Pentatricopeptide repeat-containing protein n=1 Tax=Saponaria officinalis TaxID=3572 RepID=A0AAW1J9W1_SAPOF
MLTVPSSSATLVLSNSFGCSLNHKTSINCLVYANLFSGFHRFRNSVHFRVLISTVEHGFVLGHGLDSCIESFHDDDDDYDDDSDGDEGRFSRIRVSGRNLECGSSYLKQSFDDDDDGGGGDDDDEGRFSRIQDLGRNLKGGSSNLKQSLTVSRAGEDKVVYLEERDEEELSKRILSLSRTNRRTSALMLLRSMEMSGLRPNLHACNSVLSCLSRNDMLDDLLRVFAFMKRSKILSGHSCSLVLKAVAKHRGSDTALQMFSEWDVKSEMSLHFDSVVYNTVLSICGKENNWVQMKKIWKSMKENGIIGTIVTYRVLVCTFVRCGQYEIAIDAYNEMLKNELEPGSGSDAMHAIIGACAREEKWEMALSVFHSMLKCGLKPNLVACNALINMLGKAGKVNEAYKVYKHIRSLGHVPDSYTWNALLVAFYRAEQYTAALQLFDSIQKDLNFRPSSYLYNTALMCCQRVRYWEKALQFLWKMEKSGITVSTESYNLVISACETARKPKIALQIYEHMTFKKCIPDTFTHLSLIRSCIWADLWDEVDIILDESTPNVSLYNAAIHGMCLRRKFESAKKLYIKMRDIGLVPDGKTRALMLQYMRKRT